MYLLLGSPDDLCCHGVSQALGALGHESLTLSNALAEPIRFSWSLGDTYSFSRISQEGEFDLTDKDLAGVLVRPSGWVDPSGWERQDLDYVMAETQAALLAWLWSLKCPVVNRLAPEMWHRPQAPQRVWHLLLWRCGLPTLESLITNIEADARSFGARYGGAVYTPITQGESYLVATEDEWKGLRRLQEHMPVSLTQPHGATWVACVAGDRIIWEGEPPNRTTLEPALREFSRQSGLPFVELVLVETAETACVKTVEPVVHFEHFGAAGQQEIIAALVRLLTAGQVRPAGQESAGKEGLR